MQGQEEEEGEELRQTHDVQEEMEEENSNQHTSQADAGADFDTHDQQNPKVSDLNNDDDDDDDGDAKEADFTRTAEENASESEHYDEGGKDANVEAPDPPKEDNLKPTRGNEEVKDEVADQEHGDENSPLTETQNEIEMRAEMDRLHAALAEAQAAAKCAQEDAAKKESDLRKVCQALDEKEREPSMIQQLRDENSGLRQQVKSLREALEITSAPAADPKALSEARDRANALEEKCGLLQAQLAEAVKASDDKSAEQDLEAKVSEQAAELEKQSEKLKAKARRHAQTQSQLASAQQELEAKSKALSEAESELASLRPRAEAAETALEEAKQAAARDAERASKAEDELNVAQRAREDAEARATQAEENLTSTRAALNEAREQNERGSENIKQLEKQLEEQTVEHKIASKRTLSLVKELKGELARESAASGELKRQIADLSAALDAAKSEAASSQKRSQDEINQLREALQEAQARKGPSLSALMRKRPSAPGAGNGVLHGASGNGAPTRENDTVKLDLAKRLEALLQENMALKEMRSLLETGAQSYAQEVQTLKARINELERGRRASANGDDTEVDL
ncbi:Hypothetical Protein FCC1311_106632 [Hondaea fermentalgiana]|uniref:Uncharacterized protein n=1 Tax=Hondaea fermentalgiana TaxID=2315210 RepID=A0A2R5GVT5_9STRA|nr:Hypothetical Protein FCC1311_106632 [Hondaea fermentalgiana]|eukprot:GBG34439.1 Hypothetical Protein FCC1311_106632 [Hondaea fermentalgiana]